jgi:hypothetical protein
LAACLAISHPAFAAADAPQRLTCAVLEAFDCEPRARCFSGHPAELGAPTFMHIDLEKKVIAGPHRATPIVAMERTAENLLLQGTEIGYGWTLAVDTRAGTMAATLVNREGAFVLFGACTPP